MGFGKSTGGFSLIEVLVATSLVSFGIGGMAALMLSASGGISEAQHATVAHLGADAMAATLRLSPVALEHLANPPRTGPHCFEVENCSAEVYVQDQYNQLRARIAQQLPEGQLVVCSDASAADGTLADPACDGAGPTVVKVLWREPRSIREDDGGERRAVVQVPR